MMKTLYMIGGTIGVGKKNCVPTAQTGFTE